MLIERPFQAGEIRRSCSMHGRDDKLVIIPKKEEISLDAEYVYVLKPAAQMYSRLWVPRRYQNIKTLISNNSFRL
jgi:hypothetical protein